jgi:LL-diaminopimelate aminotransferase
MKRGISIELADRVRSLPPYLFAEIDRLKQESLKSGTDLIDLSIGDPDLPTPQHVINELHTASMRPANHRYPSYVGMLSFRKAVSDWYQRRFKVTLDPNSEVLTLIGSKEGIGHIPLAFLNPGDVALVPSPGYPVYAVGTKFAGGEVYEMPLKAKNDYLPDFNIIPQFILRRAKLMFLNYPNNPTSAVATRDFYENAIDFALSHNLIICHDAAYSEIYFDNKKPLSFLEIKGSKSVGIEFHSLSKTINMTGWRIGFAVGNSDILAGLGKIKTNIDSGVFQAVQEAGIAALKTSDDRLNEIRLKYQKRRDVLYAGLIEIGLKPLKPQATFYLWTSIPKGMTSMEFTKLLLNETGVLTTPGSGFGAVGEGFIRFALTVGLDRLKEAVARIKKVKWQR